VKAAKWRFFFINTKAVMSLESSVNIWRQILSALNRNAFFRVLMNLSFAIPFLSKFRELSGAVGLILLKGKQNEDVRDDFSCEIAQV
jgi:hypothetical protein